MKELFQFFQKIETDKWSGEVQITSSEGNAALYFQKGKFLYAHRPLDRAMERLETFDWLTLPPISVSAGFKTWAELVQSLFQQNPDSTSALIHHFKSDRFEIFFRLFFWTNLELLPHGYDLTLDPSLAFYTSKEISTLLKEAKTRLSEWPLIQARIGSSRRIFVPRRKPGIVEKTKDVIDEALKNIQDREVSAKELSPDLLRIFELCDGRRTVQEIIRASADGEFLTLRRLIDLWDKGWVGPRDDDGELTLPDFETHVPVFRQIVTACFLFFAAGVLYWSWAMFLTPVSSDSDIPEQVPQALLVSRLQNGRFPITLEELQKSGLLSDAQLSSFNYQLLNSRSYDLSR